MSIEEKNEELKAKIAQAKLGGGQKQLDKQHERGKLTARERIEQVLDPGSFSELEMFVTHQVTKFGMDKEKFYGDGVVVGSGTMAGRLVYVYSQDFTVMGGSLGKAQASKITHVMDLAIKVGVPIIGIIDSGGARIQEGLGQYGSIFYRNTLASGIVPQFCLILGPCAGGAVYSPALCDFIFMVEGVSKMHITGPNVIKAVTGEEITSEELGGAKVHSQVSGVAHLVAKTEQECFDQVKKLLSFLPSNYQEAPPAPADCDDPKRLVPEVEKVIPDSPSRAYDMKKIIRAIADHNDFFEVQPDFAKNIITGFIRLAGSSVGVIANQPSVAAGALDIDASDKAARFIRFCDAFNIQILNLVDCPGYLPGKHQEFGGIIRHGAKTLFAYCEAVVPRVSVIVRKIYGGAMSGMAVSKLVGTDFTIALTTAEIAIMGPEGAANIIFKDEIAKAEDPKAMRVQKVAEYREKFANPYCAAEEGWIDAIIEPKELRACLIGLFGQLKGKQELRPGKKHGSIPL
ncbi:MAG: methylmalonyl-CoA carboxyltransferase [Deltaproteobacteria bacterium]|nr:methylmalonyl-CoA carboxyltransferase [Deltaproteobacteria bacterium]